jgi:hypothetical protein
MPSPEELEENIDRLRQAGEIADRGGARPKLEPLAVGILAAVGVFALLKIFAAVTLPDSDYVFRTIETFTIISAAGAAAIQWWRERAWQRRQLKALNEILVTKDC